MFRPGDVVKLKSGGPPMTVAEVLASGGVRVYRILQRLSDTVLMGETLARVPGEDAVRWDPETTELLPCPFCGSDDLELDGDHYVCQSCFARGPLHVCGTPLSERWNTRGGHVWRPSESEAAARAATGLAMDEPRVPEPIGKPRRAD